MRKTLDTQNSRVFWHCQIRTKTAVVLNVFVGFKTILRLGAKRILIISIFKTMRI